MPYGFHRSQKGNTLAEYALAGVLVLVVCMGGLLMAGRHLQSWLANMKEDMGQHRDVAIAAQTNRPHSNSGEPIVTNLPDTSNVPQLTEQERRLLGEPLSDKLQTTGANGTTMLLAKQLEVVAKQLLAEGKISQEQSDAIMALANQGYRMARMEQLIEQAVEASNGHTDQLMNMYVTLDGKEYLASDLPAQLGYAGIGSDSFTHADVLSDYSGTALPETATFLALYQKAIASVTGSDPEVTATIRSASTQIASIGETIEDNMWYAIHVSDQYGIKNLSDLNSRLASSATRMNATKICTSKNFSDNGALCSK